ncbi:MAG: hypothetical protein K2H09_07895, partial [Treponemataceae bacterium]|nr:hypothetical protein [Treponemataceae bacterium]
MPLKLRAHIHPFREEFEDSEVAQDTIRNIFLSLNTGTDINNAVILVEDELIVGDFERVPPDGSRVYIRILPEGDGGNLPDETKDAGKGMGWGGLGMIGAGIAALFIPYVGAALGAALIGAGIAMSVGGVVLYNTEISQPTVQDRISPEQDPSLRGARNQERQYGSIPVVFGRHLFSTDIASKTYTYVPDTDDDGGREQWIRQLFCLGYDTAEIDVDTIKLGDTNITDFSATKDISKILSGADPLVRMKIIRGGGLSYYGEKVVKEIMLNAVLKHTNDTGASGAIIRTTADNACSINVDIFFYSGLFKYNDKNAVDYLDCEVAAWYKPEEADDSQYKPIKEWKLNQKETHTLRYSASVKNLPSGKYTVKVERVTEDREGNDYIDSVYVGSIRTYTWDAPVNEDRRKDLLLLSTEIKASDMAQGVIDNLNCIITSVIPDYNGSGSGPNVWTARATRNPASEILFVLRGKINSTPVSDDDIDWPAFERFWQFCEDHHYYFNAVMTESMTISSLYMSIARVGRGAITKTDGKFSVVIDTYKDAPVQLFTPRNTISFSESILLPDIPDQIDYNFIDETSGYVQNTRSYYNKDEPRKSRQETSVWGITNPSQLYIYAKYQAGVSNNRKSVYTIQCDIEYLMCQKGDLIEYAGDLALTGVAYGRVKETIRNAGGLVVGIISDTVLPFETAEDYGLRIRKSDGRLLNLNCENTGLAERRCYFTSVPEEGSVPEPGDLFTFGIRGKTTLPLIITSIQPAENLTAEITAVDYAPEIFDVDIPGYQPPPFVSKITLGGITDSGTADISKWQTFSVYHDSEARPAKPTGDGTSGGWHAIHTAQSRWISTKTAASILEGDWQPPLPTAEQVQIIVGGPPLVPTGVYAIASKDEIRLGYNPDSSKLDTRSYVTYEISKHGAPASTVFGDVSGTYQFDRTDDGYPEAEDLALWKVRARTHNGSGTASEWSEEVSVDVSQYGTWKPVAPTGVTALAEKEYIALAWKAGNKAENKDIYGTTIFRVKRNGETVATAYSGTSYTYYFDRTIGEYPEKSDFLTEEWKFTVEASNESGNAAESDAARYNSENYLTWLPAVPKLDASASKRTVGFSIHADNSYWGWLRYEVQISRNGEDWYSCGNSDDAYLDESAWQGEMDEDTDMYSSQHFQVVPLSGQAAGRPENTTYRFRVRAITKTSKENKSEYSQSLIVLATASGVEDIVQSSITTEKLAPSAVTIDKLNVLATNLVNSLVREKPDERSVDGWTEGLTTAEDAETGFVVGLLAGKNEADSNPFQILADAVYEFKFGLEFSGAGESNGQSVGAGVKGGESYRRYRWDFVKKQWFYNDTGSDACFVSNFRSDGRKYFTTYIIGSNVDTGCVTSDGEGVSGIPARNIPAPSYTDESYQVFAVQLLPRCTETRLRISNDGSVPEHAALLLICPQVYQTGSGRIVAENVVAANLSAISAN